MTNEYDDIKERALSLIAKQWKPVTPEQEELLRDTIVVRNIKKNTEVYKKLEIPTFISYLIEGKIKICKDGIMGKNRIIRVVKPCDPFGYRAFFDNQRYTTGAMTLEDSVVAQIPITTVSTIMRHNYDFAMSLIKHLARELGLSDTRTINLTQKHVRGRLAEALIFLKDSYGVEEDGHTLSVYLSREEMANLSNMTTNNAIRTLSASASDGLILTHARNIKIPKDDDLRQISEFG